MPLLKVLLLFVRQTLLEEQGPLPSACVTMLASVVTVFIDTDRNLGNDDMKVERDSAGCIVSIAKTLTKFDCGYVGMSRVPTALFGRYFEEADCALGEEGRAIHVERILGRLAKTDLAPTCRDISGHGWLEVDTPDERAGAEAALSSGGWA